MLPSYPNDPLHTEMGESSWDKPTAPAGVSGGGPAQVCVDACMCVCVCNEHLASLFLKIVGPTNRHSIHPPSPTYISTNLTEALLSSTPPTGPCPPSPQEAPRLPPALLLAAGDHHVLQGGGGRGSTGCVRVWMGMGVVGLSVCAVGRWIWAWVDCGQPNVCRSLPCIRTPASPIHLTPPFHQIQKPSPSRSHRRRGAGRRGRCAAPGV